MHVQIIITYIGFVLYSRFRFILQEIKRFPSRNLDRLSYNSQCLCFYSFSFNIMKDGQLENTYLDVFSMRLWSQVVVS